MPIYEYECVKCNRRDSSFRHTAYRNAPMFCRECGGSMPRAIERPNVNPDTPEYLDEHLVPAGHTGPPTHVKSRRHRKELMRQYGLQEAG